MQGLQVKSAAKVSRTVCHVCNSKNRTGRSAFCSACCPCIANVVYCHNRPGVASVMSDLMQKCLQRNMSCSHRLHLNVRALLMRMVACALKAADESIASMLMGVTID